MASYAEKTLASIIEHCEVRGIPEPEAKSIVGAIEKKAGKPLGDLTDRQLRTVNQGIGAFLTAYLEGEKRRAGGPPGAKPSGTGEVSTGGSLDAG